MHDEEEKSKRNHEAEKTGPIGPSPGQKARVAVAGHICLDIIPSIPPGEEDFRNRLIPGNLIHIGAAQFSTGGSVSNTGLALHRLGVPVLLIGKIGSDPFGEMVKRFLSKHDPALIHGLVVDRRPNTSYTIIIDPPESDRTFLHWTGANDDFHAADITEEHLEGIDLFHFGYPPVLRWMYRNDGRELDQLFRFVKNSGVTTSLDMSKPDLGSEAGRVDWPRILKTVLPRVDLFLPSIDELLMVMEPGTRDFQNPEETIHTGLLDRLADRLIDMGTVVAAIKLGEYGIYLRTGREVERLARALGKTADPSAWKNRQLLVPAFRTNVVGTTGTGDCAIAGLLASIRAGDSPEQALAVAAGAGASSTENADAASGVPPLSRIRDRIAAGWERLNGSIPMPGWEWQETKGVWAGPRDAA